MSTLHLILDPLIIVGLIFVFRKPEFDTSNFEEVTNLLLGTHDFRTFMGRPAQQPANKETVRTILKLEVRQCKPFFSSNIDCAVEHYEFWEVLCQGKSFLYRQVRHL